MAELALTTREHVRRLGTFLADLTRDRPADRIHAEIIERLESEGGQADHRLAGVYRQAKDFVAIWTAIRNGASLPAPSWEKVVLPTVVRYSPAHAARSNLAAATAMWQEARSALDLPPPQDSSPTLEATVVPVTAVPALDPVPRDDGLELVLVPPDDAGPPQTPRRSRLVWFALAAVLALVVVAGTMLLTMGEGPGEKTPGEANRRSDAPIETTPSLTPSITPSATPPTPSPTPPGAPGLGAPSGLVSTGHTATTIALSWQPPAPSEDNEVAYYQVFADGAPAQGGRTEKTSHTLVNLMPGTSYRLTVVAFDSDDRPSPPSNAITVRTPASFSVPASVAYGASFGISGKGWHCAQVTVRLMRAVMPENARYRVAVPKPDANGSFGAKIEVTLDGDGTPIVRDLDGKVVILDARTWRLEAECGQTFHAANFQVRPKGERDTARKT